MPSIKPVEEASQEFTADLAALRDDVTKLTSSVSEQGVSRLTLIGSDSNTTRGNGTCQCRELAHP